MKKKLHTDEKRLAQQTAGQIWRDRLNKSKSGTRGVTSNPSAKAALVARNQFTQTASGSTDRKSRKGMRPG